MGCMYAYVFCVYVFVCVSVSESVCVCLVWITVASVVVALCVLFVAVIFIVKLMRRKHSNYRYRHLQELSSTVWLVSAKTSVHCPAEIISYFFKIWSLSHLNVMCVWEWLSVRKSWVIELVMMLLFGFRWSIACCGKQCCSTFHYLSFRLWLSTSLHKCAMHCALWWYLCLLF